MLLSLIAIVLFCSSATSYEDRVAPTVSQKQLALIDQLRREWREQRFAAPGATSDFQRPELTPLVGVHRASLASRLGRPDFCLPDPDSCGNSPHWTYFFNRCQPSSVKSSGSRLTEVTVTAGCGWALEMFFSKDGAVDKASWVNQK